jgi:hypothetical protein
LPQDEAISRQQQCLFAQAQLCECGLAGGNVIAIQQDNFCGRFHRALVKTYARAILERSR